MGDLRLEQLHPDQIAFHLEEYRATKAEILLVLRLLYEGFIWCVVTASVAAAWVTYAISDSNLGQWPGLKFAAFGPFALTVILGAGFVQQGLALQSYSEYLDRLDKLLAAEGHGLQSSVSLKRTKSFGAGVVIAAFLLLLVSTFVFGFIVQDMPIRDKS